MKQRCSNPKAIGFANYGGRGISVSKPWQNSFETFLLDMGLKPSPDHSIERKNNNGNYTRENCHWATIAEQHSNTRRTRKIQFRGRTLPLRTWSIIQGLPETTLRNRLESGWPLSKAMLTPINQKASRARSMAMKRTRSYAERLASVLLLLRRDDGSPLIPKVIAEKGTKAILASVQWDHKHPVALGGDNHCSNLQPLTPEDHLEKTKRDVKAIAKTKRISKEQEDFRRRILTPRDERPKKPSRFGSRPFPKRRTTS